MLAPPLVLLSAWVHDLDPYMVQLWEGGPIRWYGMAYLAGFVAAWLLIRRVATVGRSPLNPQRAADLVIVLAMGAMIGGRLGYCAFYQPSLLWEFEGPLPYWGLLKINKGGMASHGGILGVVVAAVWFARKNKTPLPHLLDLAAFGTPIGLMFGRIANFINGELYGRPCDPDMPLAVQFPQELLEERLDPRQLNQLTEAVSKIDVDTSTWQALIVQLTNPNDAIWRPAAAQIRSILSDLINRVPSSPAIAEALAPVLTPRHPSQLYAAFSEGVVVMLVLLIVWAKPRKPMVIGGWFALVYAVMRIVNERFRLPDAQFIELDGTLPTLTRGQLLSIGLLIFGIVLLARSRRQTQPLGGWTPGSDAPGDNADNQQDAKDDQPRAEKTV